MSRVSREWWGDCQRCEGGDTHSHTRRPLARSQDDGRAVRIANYSRLTRAAVVLARSVCLAAVPVEVREVGLGVAEAHISISIHKCLWMYFDSQFQAVTSVSCRFMPLHRLILRNHYGDDAL